MADEKVEAQKFDIPKTCKGGVVVNEGPDFYVEVQDLPVPEPGTCCPLSTPVASTTADDLKQAPPKCLSGSMRRAYVTQTSTSC